jgi:hypothetical protein
MAAQGRGEERGRERRKGSSFETNVSRRVSRIACSMLDQGGSVCLEARLYSLERVENKREAGSRREERERVGERRLSQSIPAVGPVIHFRVLPLVVLVCWLWRGG